MRTNYHTHTYRCKHASGSEEQYIEAAIKGGFDIIGIADHTPWPYRGGFESYMRMDCSELEGYVDSVRALGLKYGDRIEVKLGLECEYYTDHIAWLSDIKAQYLDYLIFGNHYPYDEQKYPYLGYCRTQSDLNLYLESSIQALQTGIYDCFAHPDLFMLSYVRFDEQCEDITQQLCQLSISEGVPLEFNTNQEYRHEFWKVVAQRQPQVIIGIDAHNPQKLSDPAPYIKAQNRLKKLGITPIETLGR